LPFINMLSFRTSVQVRAQKSKTINIIKAFMILKIVIVLKTTRSMYY